MGEVFEKMSQKMGKRLSWFNVFLTAMTAKSIFYLIATIKAKRVGSKRMLFFMAHASNIRIETKKNSGFKHGEEGFFRRTKRIAGPELDTKPTPYDYRGIYARSPIFGQKPVSSY